MAITVKKTLKKKASHRRKKPLKVHEIAREIFKDVPPEAWDDIPTDLGKYSDYYLYGGKKE
jgi:hypothetical protein